MAIVLLAVFLLVASVQALTVPADDADRVASADEIVRGTIADVQSRWNDDHTHIVTTATVTVKSRLKGLGSATETIAVLGGTVDGITEWAENEHVLNPGAEAYVFIRNTGAVGVPADGRARNVVFVVNGKVPGRTAQKDAGIPVADYDRYLQALAQGLAATLPEPVEPVTRAVGDPPVISSVSPSSGSAGTGTTVTITGTGFGTKSSRESRADVGFLSRWDGSNWTPIWASGAYYFADNANDIVSWTDTRIVVRVPTGITAEDVWGSASSGFVFVVPESGPASSSYPFTVTFGYGKAKWNAPARYYVNPGNVTGAEISIQNAAATWNAAIPTSSFRFEYQGTNASTYYGYNGQSLICFRPASEFEDPSYYGGSYVWWDENRTILEADTWFNDGFAWTTGTASGSQLSVQACALHMLGNWLTLLDLEGWYPGYPSDSGKAMFVYNGATFGNQNLKTLHADDAAGIRWIYPPQLTVSSITPGSGIPGATVSISNLAGTAFEAGATVRLTRTGQPDIVATNVVVASLTQITCRFALPVTAATGAWNVTVTNPGGASASLANGFAVNPSVTSITPNRGAQNTTVGFTIAGAGFEPNATVRLTRSGQPDLWATGVVVVSPTQLNGTFAIPLTAATGSWSVVVTNPGGTSAIKSSAFTIDPSITVVSIAPKTGVRGTTVPAVIAGTGFMPGATARLTRSGSADIRAGDVVVVSPAQIACTLVLPLTASTGTWNVVVTNPNGAIATKTSAFTITLPPISVISIVPINGTAGTIIPISIAGAEFIAGSTTVQLTRTGSSTISAGNVVVVSTGQINGSFALPETAAPGAWHVNVTNAGRSASLPDGFTVLPPTLTVTSTMPNNGTRGTTVPVAIAGAGFADGATVSLTRSGSAAIYATDVAVASPTAITCTFALPSTAATGLWNVVVSNPGGPSGTLANGFTINPGLAVTSISPNNGIRGETIAATVSGTGFVNGAIVTLARAGEPDITAAGVAVTSATRITCTLVLPADAAIGTWDVVVTTPDDESAALVNGFTIKMPPVTVLSITPNTGLRGTTVPVTIGGTEFASGATVTLTKSGQSAIVGTNVVVVSPGTITCTLELPPDAASGAWNVVVANPDGRSGTLSGGFTITLPPITVTAIAPNTGIQGTTVPVTVTGTQFESGTTSVTLTRAGSTTISATNIVVVSPTIITCALVLPPTATLGARNVVVTNLGRTATLANGFTIEPPLAVAAIAPNTGGRGTTVQVAITGTRFEPGATVSLVRLDTLDIPGTNVVVRSPTEISCEFVLPPLLDTGAWNVVVTNSSGVRATLPAGFAVFDRPPPPPVTNLRIVERTPTSIAWNWTDPTAVDFVRVQVYLNNYELENVPNGTQAYGLSGLEPNTVYTFGTRTYDSVGYPSTWVNITTRTPIADGVIPGGVSAPTDLDDDGLYEDLNGNGRKDFADVVLCFNQIPWIAENEPVSAFDYNGNGRIDFADVVWLFNHL